MANSVLGSGFALIGTPVLTGASGASGTFTGSNTIPLGFNSGIVLTTGDASIAGGSVNTSTSAGMDNSGGGDTQLSGLIGGAATYDALSLSFRFNVPASGNNLYFNYVFASEEYNEWVDHGYNDVFGFFLDGRNIALLPGGVTPVSIDNVNSIRNSAYYRSNRFGDSLGTGATPGSDGTPGPFSVEYDGLTRVLTAVALGLTPGAHSIKLAIADTGDHVYDSAVFIQAGTFDNVVHEHEREDVPDTGSTALLMSVGMIALGVFRRKD